MKTLIIALVASLIFSQPGVADDKKHPEIRIRDVIALRDALVAVTTGHDKIIGQNTSSATVAHGQLYDIDNNARWALNDNIQALTPMLSSVDKTVKEMRTGVLTANGGLPIPDKAEDQTKGQKLLLQKFTEEVNGLLDQTRELPTLAHVKRADFKEPIPSEIIVPMQQAGILDP